MASTAAPVMARIPLPLTSLIGRERELAALLDLLRRDDVRIVTLTGTGGTGKTRLAVEVATRLQADFMDGVHFIALATVIDPAVVLATIAQSLGIQERGDLALGDQIATALRAQQLLLVLDNFEQVTAAAPQIANLLAACPGIKALVTSRSHLHIRGEREFPIAPLPVPDPARLPALDELAANPAVALFLERAQAVRPDLALTAEHAPAIAEICARLDGLPLALELAAARVKLLPPAAMLPRLANRLGLLTTGPRDLPERQQTLHNAIAWSYDLLTPAEQTLFRRLAVFPGGCTLEAAEAVCDGSGAEGSREGEDPSAPASLPRPLAGLPPSVLEGIEALITHSLVRQTEEPDGEPRFAMLETIREFAAEQLAISNEETKLRSRQAAFYRKLAEQAKSALTGPQQGLWLSRLDAELPNIRAALEWTIGRGEAETAQAIASSLRRFWEARGRLTEGRAWHDRALALGGEPGEARATALLSAATLARRQGDYDRAVALYEESLTLYRSLGDPTGVPSVLNNLGVVAQDRGDYARAKVLYEESLAHFRQLGDRERIAALLNNLGIVARRQGNFAHAAALYEETLAIYRDLGDRRGVALSLNNLGVVAFNQGDLARATSLYEEALTVWRDLDDRPGLALTLHNLAEAIREQGDLAHAAALYRESLATRVEQGDRPGIAECLAGVATLAARGGLTEQAVRLLAAAEGLRAAIGVPLPPPEREQQDRILASLRRSMSVDTFEAAWHRGQALTADEAVAAGTEATTAALTAEPAVVSAVSEPSAAEVAGLTKRELEVLRLIVEGRSDKEIGEALFISHRTAMTHVLNILNKLGLNSRTAAATWAIRNGVV